MTVAGKLFTLTKIIGKSRNTWVHLGCGCLGFPAVCAYLCVWMSKNSYLLNCRGCKCDTNSLCYNSVSIFGTGLNSLAYNPWDSNGCFFFFSHALKL